MQNDNTSKSTTLEQDVESALLRIRELPDMERFRCYEFSRLLRDELVHHGYDAVVKDGIVQYAVNFFTEKVIERAKQQQKYQDWALNAEEKYRKKIPDNEKKKMIIFHSWLKVEDTVVDYHHVFAGTPFDLLIVSRKDELHGKALYVPIGGEINILGRTFIYNSPLITRLRL